MNRNYMHISMQHYNCLIFYPVSVTDLVFFGQKLDNHHLLCCEISLYIYVQDSPSAKTLF